MAEATEIEVGRGLVRISKSCDVDRRTIPGAAETAVRVGVDNAAPPMREGTVDESAPPAVYCRMKIGAVVSSIMRSNR